MVHFDALVIGAGAAGMMCAATAGQGGARVLLVDHAVRLAEKIRISGGGRCNFTNVDVRPECFVSANPQFCRSALAGYSAADFIALVRRHGVAFHEKHRGQLFCDDSADRIIALLRDECDAGGVQWRVPCAVERVEAASHGYTLDLRDDTGSARVQARRVVVATGGLSIPAIGATDFGYRLARQFALSIVEPRPALVPLTFAADVWQPFVALAGVALEVDVRCGGGRFREDLLFTHKGLSGPAILQISTYWNPGEPLLLNLVPALPGPALLEHLLARKPGGRQALVTVLAELLPRRLAEGWLALQRLDPEQRLADCSDRSLRALAHSLQQWALVPSGTAGFRKAEVTRGGVSTAELAQATLEARRAPGLHFIGEVVDVTGWLGGYNFQWAWSSGVAAGRAIAAAS